MDVTTTTQPPSPRAASLRRAAWTTHRAGVDQAFEPTPRSVGTASSHTQELEDKTKHHIFEAGHEHQMRDPSGTHGNTNTNMSRRLSTDTTSISRHHNTVLEDGLSEKPNLELETSAVDKPPKFATLRRQTKQDIIRLVASPQRAGIHRTIKPEVSNVAPNKGSATVAIGAKAKTNSFPTTVEREHQQTKDPKLEKAAVAKKNPETGNSLKQLRKQSDTDRRARMVAEAEAKELREKVEQLERQIAERDALAGEAKSLRNLLEEERHTSQMQREALKNERQQAARLEKEVVSLKRLSYSTPELGNCQRKTPQSTVQKLLQPQSDRLDSARKTRWTGRRSTASQKPESSPSASPHSPRPPHLISNNMTQPEGQAKMSDSSPSFISAQNPKDHVPQNRGSSGSGSCDGHGSPLLQGEEDEVPAPGYVAEKVHVIEQRCSSQTPKCSPRKVLNVSFCSTSKHCSSHSGTKGHVTSSAPSLMSQITVPASEVQNIMSSQKSKDLECDGKGPTAQNQPPRNVVCTREPVNEEGPRKALGKIGFTKAKTLPTKDAVAHALQSDMTQSVTNLPLQFANHGVLSGQVQHDSTPQNEHSTQLDNLETERSFNNFTHAVLHRTRDV